MRFNNWRRSNNPLTKKIDAEIDNHLASGWQVTTGSVAEDVVSNASGKLMINTFEHLVGPRVRRRLVQRGFHVVDADTLERVIRDDVTASQFRQQVQVQSVNSARIMARLRANRAVLKFLEAQEASLGRPVTMGEVSKDVQKIYAKHGF